MTIEKTNNFNKGKKIIDKINVVLKDWEYFASKASVRADLHKDIQNNFHIL